MIVVVGVGSSLFAGQPGTAHGRQDVANVRIDVEVGTWAVHMRVSVQRTQMVEGAMNA